MTPAGRLLVRNLAMAFDAYLGGAATQRPAHVQQDGLSMGVPEVDAVVAGAGIAGLAAALELQGRGREVLVIDPSDRPGGVLRTDHVAGYVVERGPNTALVKAPMRRFLGERGLEDTLLAGASREPAARTSTATARWCACRSSPLGLLTHAAALGARQAAPARASRSCAAATRAARASPSSSRGAPATRSVRALVGPFLTGVYAGDETQLGAEAVFGARGRARAPPRLARARRARGGALAAPRARTARKLVGPARLRPAGARARRASSPSPPALGSRVARIARDGDAWRLDDRRAERRHARCARAASCSPCRRPSRREVAARRRFGDRLGARGIAYAPIVSVALGVDPRTRARASRASASWCRATESLRLLGCLFMSQLFPGRAPEGSELLQCMLGGVRWPEAVAQPDDALLAALHADLERALGYRGEPLRARDGALGARDPAARARPRRARALRAAPAEAGPRAGGLLRDGDRRADALASGLAAARRLSGLELQHHLALAGRLLQRLEGGRELREVDDVGDHRRAGDALGGEHVERELEVLAPVADDEAQVQLLHDREEREERVGLHADAHHHDPAARWREQHALLDHARDADALEDHVRGPPAALAKAGPGMSFAGSSTAVPRRSARPARAGPPPSR